MRIGAVTPAVATRRDSRRSAEDIAYEDRPRYRFSQDYVILDLSADAMRQTGQGNPARARQRFLPPDTYDQSGSLAYYDPPEPTMILAHPVEPDPEELPETPETPAAPTIVAFDGMLRAPARSSV